MSTPEDLAQSVSAVHNPFADHEIVSEVRAEGFASWLMRDGGCSSEFWCRVTAADGLLRVSGDIDPVVFQGNLSHNDDPESRVAWMGARKSVDAYVMEKASTGTGWATVRVFEVEAAKEDLRKLIANNEEEIVGYEEEIAGYADPEADYADYIADMQTLRDENAALTAGLTAAVGEYTSQPWECAEVLAMCEAIRDYSYRVHAPELDRKHPNGWTIKGYRTQHVHVEGEVYGDIGKRPAQRVVFAHQAVQRLHALLTARREPSPEVSQ